MGLKRVLIVTSIIVTLLWFFAQVVVIVLYWDKPQYSDAANYLAFANQAAKASSWYPTAEMFNNNAWIANTGYINLLVLNLKLFGTTAWVALQQLVLNVLLLLSFARIVKDVSGETVARLAVIIFCLLPSNILVVVCRMSDVPCVALLMLSFAIIRPDWRYILASGIIAALANWVRPIGTMYWPSLFLFAILKKAPIKCYVAYVAGIAVTMAAIGCLTYSSCGYPLTGSTTKGTNMIMGCWDGAQGRYDDEVFSPGNSGYIEPELGYNVVERDSCLTTRSVEWILNNPKKFLTLVPKKMFYLWGHDSYAEFVLKPNPDHSLTHQMVLSIPYYLLLMLSVCGIWMRRRNLFGISGIILLPVILGCGAHILMYGGGRYHYPLLPPLIYFAAVALWFMFRKYSATRLS